MPLSNGGITPGFLLQDARYNNSLSPYAYDPNQAVDPTAAIQMQQQYLKQMFAMQNPRQALPQQFGAALGAALSGQRAGGQQMPQGPGPQSPTAQFIHQRSVELGKSMDAGQALYMAAAEAEQNPVTQSDPVADKVIDKARTWAIEKYKYDPNLGKAAKLSAQNETENLTGPEGTRAFRKGTTEWQTAIDSGQYKKAGEIPQLKPGDFQEMKVGGMYHTYVVQPNGDLKLQAKSTQPMQYQVSGTPEQMAEGGLIRSTGTTAANDKNRKELADRQIATVNALRGLDSVSDTIKSSQGSAVGTAGDWYERGNNIVQTARNLAGNFNQQDLIDPKTYNWKGLDTVVGKVRGKAIEATKYHSQMVATAYMMAAAQSNNNTDEKMTRQRIEANLQMLAEHSDDPKAVLGALDTAKDQLVGNFKTQAKVYDPSYQASALDDYIASKKPKKTSGPYSDAEKEKRYQAWKKAHNGGS